MPQLFQSPKTALCKTPKLGTQLDVHSACVQQMPWLLLRRHKLLQQYAIICRTLVTRNLLHQIFHLFSRQDKRFLLVAGILHSEHPVNFLN